MVRYVNRTNESANVMFHKLTRAFEKGLISKDEIADTVTIYLIGSEKESCNAIVRSMNEFFARAILSGIERRVVPFGYRPPPHSFVENFHDEQELLDAAIELEPRYRDLHSLVLEHLDGLSGRIK